MLIILLFEKRIGVVCDYEDELQKTLGNVSRKGIEKGGV